VMAPTRSESPILRTRTSPKEPAGRARACRRGFWLRPQSTYARSRQLAALRSRSCCPIAISRHKPTWCSTPAPPRAQGVDRTVRWWTAAPEPREPWAGAVVRSIEQGALVDALPGIAFSSKPAHVRRVGRRNPRAVAVRQRTSSSATARRVEAPRSRPVMRRRFRRDARPARGGRNTQGRLRGVLSTPRARLAVAADPRADALALRDIVKKSTA